MIRGFTGMSTSVSPIRHGENPQPARATEKTSGSIAYDDYKLLVAWPESRSGSEKASALEIVNKPGNESAKGHLLIGQFKRPEPPSKGFESVIHFGSAA